VTGPRTTVTISGQMFVTDPCFVADEIIFTGQGELIFGLTRSKDTDTPQRDCAVICRKLTVQAGQPQPLRPGRSREPVRQHEPYHVF
jgi:hypothetical protein